MKRLAILAALLASPAVAQQAQLPAADRIAMQIGALIIQTQQQQDQITSLQDRLAKAQARISELEPKPAKPE